MNRHYVPDLIRASITVLPSTTVKTFDFHPDSDAPYRVIGVYIGDLTIHFGISEGDAEIVAAIDNLLPALNELRAAALERMCTLEPVA